MQTAEITANMEMLDKVEAWITAQFQPILDANSGVWPRSLEGDSYYDTIEQMRTLAQEAKMELRAKLPPVWSR